METAQTAAGQLEELQARQKALEQEERYAEAETVLNKIQELLQKSQRQQKNQLQTLQSAELQRLELTFKEAVAEFKANWHAKQQELLNEQTQEMGELQNQQRQRRKQEELRLENLFPVSFKPSANLLNLIKCKEQAVRLKQYAEAEALKNNIAATTRSEQNCYREERQRKIEQHLATFDGLCQKERQRLSRKHQIAMDELNIYHTEELERQTRKFQNSKNDLLNAQTIELNMAGGKQTSGVGRDLSPVRHRLFNEGSPKKRKV